MRMMRYSVMTQAYSEKEIPCFHMFQISNKNGVLPREHHVMSKCQIKLLSDIFFEKKAKFLRCLL